MEKLKDGTWFIPASEAKDLWRTFKQRGFSVDNGRCTGNIWTVDKVTGKRKIRITWNMKDMKGNWSIEFLKNDPI